MMRCNQLCTSLAVDKALALLQSLSCNICGKIFSLYQSRDWENLQNDLLMWLWNHTAAGT